MRTLAVPVLLLILAAGMQARAETASVCGTIQQCDTAIRTNPSLAAYQSRGYLHLVQRRGLEDLEKAIADFSAAIAIEARPFSLYARGMARLMAGDAAGQNEMEAAIMLQRDIEEEFKRYGAQ